MDLRVLYIGLLLVLLQSCTKNLDDFGPQTDVEDNPVPQAERIIVINEGNFMFGNGTISILNNSSDEVVQEVFKNENNYPLGDVPQSITIYDSLGFIVVNNSGKIEVVNQSDFSSIETITGFTSPRYLEVVNTNPLIAWVTDLYANKIWEVDLETFQIIGTIDSEGWNENIVSWNSQVLILNKKDSVINVFDKSSKQKINEVGVGMEIVDFKSWSKNELLVLSNSGVYVLDLPSMSLSSKTLFDAERKPSKLAVDTILDLAYFLEKDVFRATSSVEQVVSSFTGASFYGLTVNSNTGELFITDAKDYVQPGALIKYNSQFTDSVIYEVGINPQFLLVN